jgi:hypothetical protein
MADENDVVLVNAPATGTVDPFSRVGMELPDDDPVVKALNLSKGQPEQVEQKTETEVVGPTGEPKAEPQSELAPPQAAEAGTVTPEAKPEKTPYTEDELRSLLADPDAVLDTSRLDERGQAIHKEFQRGYTHKFEALKREKEEVARRQAEIAAFEERQRQLEEQRRYDAEVAELGEEEAKRNQERRQVQAEVANLRAILERMQWKEASNAFRSAFKESAPHYNLPDTPENEEVVMSYVWAQNQKNRLNGTPEIGIEEGVKYVSSLYGYTNPNNLEKIITANSEFKKAYDQKVIANYLKQKAAGATVPASSAAPVADNKPSEKEAQVDLEAFQKDPSAALLERVNRRLEEMNLQFKT